MLCFLPPFRSLRPPVRSLLSSLSSLSAVAFFLGDDGWASDVALRRRRAPTRPFPFRGAKSGTTDPNVSHLYSDLTQLRAYMCILPANFRFFFARNHRVYICAHISYICRICPLLDFWIEFCLQGLIAVLPQWSSGTSKLLFYSPAQLLALVA